MTSKTVLDEAASVVSTERQSDYDHPYSNFSRIADIWKVILKVPVTEEQVGLCMIGVKLAREAYKHKHDNLVDICGYVRCIEQVIEVKSGEKTEA